MVEETCQGKKVVAAEVDHTIFYFILEGKDLLLSFVRELKSRENSVLCSHMAESEPRAPSTHTHYSIFLRFPRTKFPRGQLEDCRKSPGKKHQWEDHELKAILRYIM